MQKKAILLLSSSMFVAAASGIHAQTSAVQAYLSQIGDILAPAAGQQMVIEDFTTVTGTSTVGQTVAQAVTQQPVTQFVQSTDFQPVQPVTTLQANVPSQVTTIQTTQPQTSLPADARNYYYYYTQPATEYGAPVQQPIAQPAVVAPAAVPVAAPVAAPVPVQPFNQFEQVFDTSAAPLPPVTYRNYLSLKGSYSKPDSFVFERTPGTGITVENEDGYALLGALGHRFGAGRNGGTSLRTEIEGGHREYQVKSMTGLGLLQGKTSVSSAMVNGLIEVGTGTAIQPYLGVGGGAAQVRHADYYATGGNFIMDDRDIAPAAQGIAGVQLNIGQNVGVSLEGRHFRAFDVRREAATGTATENDFSVNEVGLGLNFNF